MTVEEYEKNVIEHAVSDLNDLFDRHLNIFTSPYLFERAVNYTMEKVPLRLKLQVCEQVQNHLKEKWPEAYEKAVATCKS